MTKENLDGDYCTNYSFYDPSSDWPTGKIGSGSSCSRLSIFKKSSIPSGGVYTGSSFTSYSGAATGTSDGCGCVYSWLSGRSSEMGLDSSAASPLKMKVCRTRLAVLLEETATT